MQYAEVVGISYQSFYDLCSREKGGDKLTINPSILAPRGIVNECAVFASVCVTEPLN